MAKKTNIWVSFFVAILFYTFVIALLLSTYDRDIETQKFATLDQAIEVNIEVNSENQKQQEPSFFEPQSNKVNPSNLLLPDKSDKSKISDKKIVDIKTLFGEVIEKKPSSNEQTQKLDQKIQNHFKPSLNDAITKQTLNLNQLVDVAHEAKATPKNIQIPIKGESDPYFSKISMLILQRWYSYPLVAKTKYLATANISIDSKGNFNYVMVEFSTDKRVNKAVVTFLEDQKLISYPVAPDGLRKNIKINFKPSSQ